MPALPSTAPPTQSTAQSVVGLAASDLTQRCGHAYHRLLMQTDRPERILFLVRNQRQKMQVMQQLQTWQPDLMGPLHIETFLQFVNRMLRLYWAEIRHQIPSLPIRLEPLVLAKDLTQYLLASTCQLCPQHAEIFGNSHLKDYQVWDQISSAAYIAGSSGLPPEAVGSRLAQAWPESDNPLKHQQLASVSCCLTRLRQAVSSLGSLDFGTQITWFQRYILPLPSFWQELDHLIVDHAEDSCAVALDFYEQGIPQLKSLFFTYTVGGGASFTAVPTHVYDFIWQKTQVTLDPPPATHPFLYWGLQIAKTVYPPFQHPFTVTMPEAWPSIEVLDGETQLDAVEAMLTQMEALRQAGVEAQQMAVITPHIDAALTIPMQRRLGSVVLPVGQFPALISYPLIRALLTALELAHPQWGSFPRLSEFKMMVGIMLGLDPIRAELLAEDTLDVPLQKIRPMNAVRMPERIGFAYLLTYQQLWEWLQQYAQRPPVPIDQCLSQLFRDLLALVIQDPSEQFLIQNLIETAQRFRRALPQAQPRDFVAMIRSGQTSSRRVEDPDYAQSLVVATPVGYNNLGLRADYQFWFDITHEAWSRSLWYPLYNARVLTPEWDEQPFDTADDELARQQMLAHTLLSLSGRIRQKLWLVRASFNFRGEENTSSLDQLILQASQLS
ncbi:MAG: hypothetical protein NW237_06650 [Cyanobacteriota bacterium]|nr:hypothetical protein [Cyanobacteriota bacterium]